MKEDYNDKDQKIFISWTREEISHVIGNMNIIQGDQMEMKTHTPGKQRKSYHWKYVNLIINTRHVIGNMWKLLKIH